MPPLFSRPSAPRPQASTTAQGRPRVPVRPWVPSPADAAPPSATPLTPGNCDTCPADARTVFVRLSVDVPDGWTVAEAGVRELHLCAHHANRAESTLEAAGWLVVADTRSRVGV